MSEVESGASPDVHARLILPYTLWPQGHATALDDATLCALPFVQHTLMHTARTVGHFSGSDGGVSLSMPHECARAAQLGWPVVDGLLPWAAQAAVQQGLARPGDGSAWGWITLCHWQISHGQATLTDPVDLDLDEATDAACFAAMQPFFAEDGLTLYRHQPGVWLVQSPGLAALPTASLDRVIGQDVDDWLVGSVAARCLHSTAIDRAQVALWQRLQNEMQMLLYTHPVNAQRQVPVNSFWLHGTGAVPHSIGATSKAMSIEGNERSEVSEVSEQIELDAACAALRSAYLSHHPQAWMQAWQRLDAVLAHLPTQEWVLCGAHALHTHARQAASGSVWASLKRVVRTWMGGASQKGCAVLTEAQEPLSAAETRA